MEDVFYIDGGFREDERMQMGRGAGPHLGHRFTFLLAQILQHASAAEGWGEVSTSDVRVNTISNVSFKVMTFQDDLSGVVIGEETAKMVEELITQILQEELVITFSEKPEAETPFSPVFDATREEYDAISKGNVQCRSRREKGEKLKQLCQTLAEKKGHLITIREMQKYASLLQFAPRFVEDGRAHMNSENGKMAAVRNMGTNTPLVQVAAETVEDAMSTDKDITEDRTEPLVCVHG